MFEMVNALSESWNKDDRNDQSPSSSLSIHIAHIKKPFFFLLKGTNILWLFIIIAQLGLDHTLFLLLTRNFLEDIRLIRHDLELQNSRSQKIGVEKSLEGSLCHFLFLIYLLNHKF